MIVKKSTWHNWFYAKQLTNVVSEFNSEYIYIETDTVLLTYCYLFSPNINLTVHKTKMTEISNVYK